MITDINSLSPVFNLKLHYQEIAIEVWDVGGGEGGNVNLQVGAGQNSSGKESNFKVERSYYNLQVCVPLFHKVLWYNIIIIS